MSNNKVRGNRGVFNCKYPVRMSWETGEAENTQVKMDISYDFKDGNESADSVDFDINLTVKDHKTGKRKVDYKYKAKLEKGAASSILHRFDTREKGSCKHEIDLQAEVKADFDSNKIYLANGTYYEWFGEEEKEYPIKELVLFQWL